MYGTKHTENVGQRLLDFLEFERRGTRAPDGKQIEKLTIIVNYWSYIVLNPEITAETNLTGHQSTYHGVPPQFPPSTQFKLG